ncbi:GNAT family N-acetyltransferase [Algoriphagus sp.]|uniref:GNAT family N-acetyltransferase n=1 Tax=Algoriphagus sp. TaxID=1872435 RepID=UPI00391CE446
MLIRKASESDIPQIIELLKISLGESLIPKSEALWKWKHLDNPHGKSPVLLAEEDGKLIGVRAFLRWDFVEKGLVYKACRAVDTATHPEYQGKGIFKNLTLSLIEEIKEDDVELIFNTPNSKSTPGYVKMGWEKWGKLPLKLNFHFPEQNRDMEGTRDWSLIEGLIKKIESSEQNGHFLQTRLVSGYFHWRYRDNPLFPYDYLSDGANYLLIYRIKEGKMGREFRICDFFTTGGLLKSVEKNLQVSLNQRIKSSGSRFSSFSGLAFPNQKILDMGAIPILKIGPLVTLRKVQDEFSPMNMAWAWSLGDLEVF